MEPSSEPLRFSDHALAAPILRAVESLGYETPTPIQARAIPFVLAGRDLLGQAQTGTGKTGAFALPILSRLDLSRREPQFLVLAPTRELALQVSEAFQRYAQELPGFRVLPVYGGQGYETQLRPLRRGVHGVVGTPGRLIDLVKRGSLKLDGLDIVVVDEADEMLRMGFLEDVEWLLEKAPRNRQTALFSATMPEPIRRIASRFLRDPEEVRTQTKLRTADAIRQRFQIVRRFDKVDALTRILEVEPFEAVLVFVRTKIAAIEVAEKLSARGHACAALNGDLPQAQRERTMEKLRSGELDLVVATDVAARGLDVQRISLVVNFDAPHDSESYVHRIGRTGRAGREGEAILFVTPKERRMLKAIERAIGQQIEPMRLPSLDEVNEKRLERFKERILTTIREEDLAEQRAFVTELVEAEDISAVVVAAALARMAQGESALRLEEPASARQPLDYDRQSGGRDSRGPRDFRNRRDGEPRSFGDRRGGPGGAARKPFRKKSPVPGPAEEHGMERYRVEVGYAHGVKPGHIVGAIANEAGLEGKHIGRIEIYDDFSTVDLPEGMPQDVFQTLQHARVRQHTLRISRL